MSIEKRDSIGRVRAPGQNDGRKIPIQTFGGMTGTLEVAELPENLGRHGEAFWLAARDAMSKMGILERADVIALQMAADAWESYVTAKERIGSQHLLVTERGGYQRNPEYVTLENSRTMVAKMINYLGMTPAARAKFAKPEEEDPLQKLMRQVSGPILDAD